MSRSPHPIPLEGVALADRLQLDGRSYGHHYAEDGGSRSYRQLKRTHRSLDPNRGTGRGRHKGGSHGRALSQDSNHESGHRAPLECETQRDDLRQRIKGRPLRQLHELGYDRAKF